MLIGMGLAERADPVNDGLQQMGSPPPGQGHGDGINRMGMPPDLDLDLRFVSGKSNISDQ